MVLDKVHEVQEIGKGNTPCIVAIDKGGSIILGVPHKIRIPHRTTKIKQTSYVTRICPSNYKHINGVNQCEVDTILFCEATNNELLKWELEVNITFYYSMEKTILIPDVFVECKFKNINWLAFLEYDTGSENHRNKDDFPVIREKLDKYRKYKLSEIWRDKYKRFPMILLVTEDEKRVQWFTNRCRELGLEGFGVYYKQYVKVLETLSRMSK